MVEKRVELIDIGKIIPGRFRVRETIDHDALQKMAMTIKHVDLLQPVTVRPRGNKYEIIQGERRWRAAKLAGLKQLPCIVKEVNDRRAMMESLIENVHREDLKPIEKARGLAEVYRLMGFEPMSVGIKLHVIDNKIRGYAKYKPSTPLKKEEKRLKKVADMVALSYDYQYRLLTQLRLTPEEQKRVSELGLGYEEIATIATVDEPEIRKRFIEIAPELKRAEIKKVSKVVKEAPKPVVESVLKREVAPEVAEEIAKIEKPEIMKDALEIARRGVYTVEGIKTRITQLMKPPIELPEEPIDVQIFNKTMWNLDRIGDYDFYTIGYAKKTVEQFLELLKAKGVKTLVDVRKNPASMFKPEFNKKSISKILKKNGIGYVHHPELGVPEDIRAKLAKTGDYMWFFGWYDENVITTQLVESVHLEALSYPIAIMCVELDPTKCHRHRLALALEKRGLQGIDL